jgi:hypothetical protein
MNPNEVGYLNRQVGELRTAFERLTAGNGILSDYKRSLAQLSAESQNLQDTLRNTSTERNELRGQVGALRAQLTDIQARFDLNRNSTERPRTIDDIPGVRTPQWYTVEVEFSEGETVTKFGTSEIAPEGPFIITQINPLFQVLSNTAPSTADLIGRLIPVSAATIFYNSVGTSAGVDTVQTIAAAAVGVPEFTFQIEIQGSGRFWTNLKVPGAFFYGNNNPMYTGIMGWVDYSDRIKVHVTPERAVPFTGKVLFGLHGYQILNPVKLTQMLGFA